MLIYIHAMFIRIWVFTLGDYKFITEGEVAESRELLNVTFEKKRFSETTSILKTYERTFVGKPIRSFGIPEVNYKKKTFTYSSSLAF